MTSYNVSKGFFGVLEVQRVKILEEGLEPHMKPVDNFF